MLGRSAFRSLFAMTIGLCTWAAFTAQALALPPAVAKDGHGASHITFSSPAIYDLTTIFSTTGADGLTISRVVLHHASGHLIGEGRDFGGDFNVRHEIKGTVKASRGVTVVKETTHSWGSIDTSDPEQYKAVTWVNATIEGDAYDAKYKGSIYTKFCMTMFDPIWERKEKVCVRNEIPQELDYSGDGIWTVVLQPLARFGKDLFGTATIYVADGFGGGERSADVTVEGRIGKNGLATLKMKASGEDPLGSVTLKAFVTGGESGDAPTLGTIHSVSGKLLGQKFSEGY